MQQENCQPATWLQPWTDIRGRSAIPVRELPMLNSRHSLRSDYEHRK